MDYKEAYLFLFRAITKALGEIEKSGPVPPETARGVDTLKASQVAAEMMYIEGGDDSP